MTAFRPSKIFHNKILFAKNVGRLRTQKQRKPAEYGKIAFIDISIVVSQQHENFSEQIPGYNILSVQLDCTERATVDYLLV